VKVHDIIDRLTVLGLDQDEAAVYVHLSMMGPSKASDVAAAVKLHRTEAYRTLQNLVQRGFASATLSRPAKFEAAPPERLFEDILAQQRAKAETIARAQGEIAGALTTLRTTQEPSASRNTFKVLQGRREIYSVLERMLRDAQQEALLLSTHEAGLSMADTAGLLDLAVQRARDGVRVDVVTRGTPASRPRLAQLAGTPNLALRDLDADRIMRFAVVDGKELLVWVVSDPSPRMSSEEDVAIWTDASGFVGTQQALFRAVWEQARDVRSLPDAKGVVPQGGR
jgi:sugar-specific transcriptional regulator TrmB